MSVTPEGHLKQKAPFVATLVALTLGSSLMAGSVVDGRDNSVPGPAVEVREVMDLQMRWAGIPGMAVAVVQGGTLVHRQAIGLANVELRAPLTTASVFQLSSTSKIFAGVAAVLLAQDGRVDLDAPARRYLGELPPAWGTVTVRQLLSHTSGLPEVLDCEAESAEDAFACVTRLPVQDPPGARFRYNQTNYFLVLMLIERVSGTPFQDFMRSRVFAPSGMVSSTYAGSPFDLVPGRATSYGGDDEGSLRLREYDFPEFLYTAAGLNSSLDDLVRFDQALGSGRLLDEDGLRQLWQEPVLTDGRTSTYGLGWDLKTHEGGRRSAGHEGGGLTTLRRFIDDHVTVIVLSNGAAARFDPDRVATRVAAIFAPELASPADDLADAMRTSLLDDDLEGALAAHESFAADARLSGVSTEGMINDLGYALLGRGRPHEAVAVLRLNVDRYPDSSNAHDSLGEAQAAAGHRGAALASYRESLRLDPSNDNAARVIEQLKAVVP